MLRDTSKEVKNLIYTVNNIIPGEDIHIKMDRDEIKEVEVLEEAFIFLKIYISERMPPVKINFNYLNEGDLKVYVSRKHERPSDTACEKQYSRPRFINFKSVEPVFEKNFLYMKLFSYQGVVIQVKVSFPKEDYKDR